MRCPKVKRKPSDRVSKSKRGVGVDGGLGPLRPPVKSLRVLGTQDGDLPGAQQAGGLGRGDFFAGV